MARIRVAIAVKDEALTRVADVLRACSAMGFRIDSELTVIGVFTGSVAPDKLAALRSVPGVAAVELPRDVQVNPGSYRPN